MIEKALMLWVGVSVGNFIYQAFTKKDWKRATEISFFQAVPLALFVGTF